MSTSTLSERRGKLARYTRQLNARGRAAAVPCLLLMTDDRLSVDWVAAVRALPVGSGVIVRHRDARLREALAMQLQLACRARRVVLLVADDVALAVRCGADGAHVPQAQAARIAGVKQRQPRWLVTTSAHDEAAVVRAGRLGADAVLVSPVFATSSHAGAAGLGVVRFAALASRSEVPVLALGGLTLESVTRLHAPGLAGIALISGWL
jgi:thiamine-phosphate pyrophosphorylase